MNVTVCDRCKKPYRESYSWEQCVLPTYQVFTRGWDKIDLCPHCQEEFDKRFEKWLNDSDENIIGAVEEKYES